MVSGRSNCSASRMGLPMSSVSSSASSSLWASISAARRSSATLARRQRRPGAGLEGAAGGGHGAVDIGLAAGGHVGQLAAVDRAAGLECRAVGGIGVGAVDVGAAFRAQRGDLRLPVIQRVQCHVVQLPLRPARATMASSSTLQPASRCCGCASSISLWLTPSLQGHEDHGGGRDRGHVHRVVSGAGDDVHGRQATVGGALAHLADQVGIEGRGPEILHVLQFHLDMVGRRHVLAGLAQRLVHAGERGFVLVAQVGRHAHLSGDDVARAGMGVQLAHRASAMRLVGVGDADHRLHQVAGRQQRVATDRHGRGAGVHFHAGHDDVVPAQAQRSGDHAHDLSSCSRIGPCSMCASK